MFTWARNTLTHHLYCRAVMSGCDPDWLEQVACGLTRPRCLHCRRLIP